MDDDAQFWFEAHHFRDMPFRAIPEEHKQPVIELLVDLFLRGSGLLVNGE